MPESVIKRDGRLEVFDRHGVSESLLMTASLDEPDLRERVPELTDQVVAELDSLELTSPNVDMVQDAIESILLKNRYVKSAKIFIASRFQKEKVAEEKYALMDGIREILREASKENANIGNSPSGKLHQIATAASAEYYLDQFIPEPIADAHREGRFHIHDIDFYGKTLNCLQIELGQILSDGFQSPYGHIPAPTHVRDAATVALLIIQNNQNDMYGGQSFPHFDRSMAAFIRDVCPDTTEDEILDAMTFFVRTLNTAPSRDGAQVPFSSVNFGTDTSSEGRMVSEALLKAFDGGMGKGETPIFPNLVFRLKEGVNFNPDDPNYDLFQLAIRISSRRMNPTYSFMDASYNAKFGDEVAYMGCRSRVMANRNGEEIAARRGNIAPVTLNLPGMALRNRRGGVDAFFKDLDECLDLCHEQLLHRHRVLGKLKVKDFPFLMRQRLYLGSENLKDDDDIAPALRNGTLAIGYIGLAEALTVLTGKHHGQCEKAFQLGLQIAQRISDAAVRFSEEDSLNYVAYGTPAEGLSGRFTRIDRKVFGVVEGVTDKDYYTNSFHVPVDQHINLFEKMTREGAFHKLCQAGHISYVELPSAPINNPSAVEKILRHMRESDVGYAGVNFPIDECGQCGLNMVIDDQCPSCGSDDIRRIRRITGYLSTIDRFNAGKKAELLDRVVHDSNVTDPNDAPVK